MSLLVRLLFLLGDILFLNLSIAFAFYFTGSVHRTDLIYLVIFSNLAWLFLIAVASPYSFSRSWDRPKTIKNQFIFIFIHLLVVASLIFFYDREYALLQIALIYCFFVPAFYTAKFVAHFFMQHFGSQTHGVKNILMVSSTGATHDAKQYLVNQIDWKYNFIEFVNVPSQVLPMEKIRLLCDEYVVDEIFVCLPLKPDLNELIDFGLAKLIPIKLMTDLRLSGGNSADEKHFNQISYENLSTVSLDDQGNQIIKRIFDLIFSSLFILTIMSWLFPLVAILIKMDSNGPVFFKQKRNGRMNRPFTCIKFRSMVVNDASDTIQATKNDSRVTKIGQFIRRTSIDELPQFFNVFIGDMSLIGPRPHPIKINEKFAPQIKKLTSRHYVKPGITGLAQAMGYRGETSTLSDMKNRITLDRFYIENWSFALDLKIVYLTIISLLRGSEKAY